MYTLNNVIDCFSGKLRDDKIFCMTNEIKAKNNRQKPRGGKDGL